MPEKPDDDPFHDCELAPEKILGMHTCENALFTDATETAVNVLTGGTPAHARATVEEAKEFAASIDTETPRLRSPHPSSRRSKHRASPTRRPRSSASRELGRSNATVLTLYSHIV